jgi:hypothetical protein
MYAVSADEPEPSHDVYTYGSCNLICSTRIVLVLVIPEAIGFA